MTGNSRAKECREICVVKTHGLELQMSERLLPQSLKLICSSSMLDSL